MVTDVRLQSDVRHQIVIRELRVGRQGGRVEVSGVRARRGSQYGYLWVIMWARGLL